MFERIMVPVDLSHLPGLERSLEAAAQLARAEAAPVTFVAVTSPQPGPVARSPEAFAERLEAFAAEQAAAHGIETRAHAVTVPDPRADLDDALLNAVSETGADLVVMASHPPGLAEYLWPSNGGRLAAHARASVFVVRDP